MLQNIFTKTLNCQLVILGTELLIFLYSKRDMYLMTAGATIVCTTNEGLFARCRSFQTSTLRFVHRQSSGFSVIQHLRNMLSYFRGRKN